MHAETPSLKARHHVPEDLLRDVVAGLSRRPRTLPCKHFYDKAGSLLFDRICELPEYYLTRAETALLTAHLDAIAGVVGARGALVELGSGSSVKTRMLLDRLPDLARYVPIDLSSQHLYDTAASLRARYPRLAIEPVVADYALPLPDLGAVIRAPEGGHTTVFFPGSSVGNFEPGEVVALLGRMRDLAGPEGVVLVGADVGADPDAVVAAYNDAAGVTAAFNLNLLARINRELEGTFALDRFHHEAAWQPDECRVEMRLVSDVAQVASVAGRELRFAEGERIVTEHCYKYPAARFREMARRAGLEPGRCWMDPSGRMAMHELRVREAPARGA